MRDGKITCKFCEVKYTYIIRHLNQTPECKNTYSVTEYAHLEQESKELTRKNKLIRKRAKYDPAKRAEKYKKEKAEQKPWIKRGREKYDPVARAKRYHHEKGIAIKKKHRNDLNKLLKKIRKENSDANDSCRKSAERSLQIQSCHIKETILSKESKLAIKGIKDKIKGIHKFIKNKILLASSTAKSQQMSLDDARSLFIQIKIYGMKTKSIMSCLIYPVDVLYVNLKNIICLDVEEYDNK